MGGLGPETRAITDSLDELGNTTAAMGKGFAIGAAALAALAIIAAFVETVTLASGGEFVLHLGNPMVLIGLFIGGLVPFLIASITMTSVGEAAMEMIEEIRRQFREIPGLMEGTADPDNAKCVVISTNAALKKMMLPGVIAVAVPPAVGFGLGAQALGGKGSDVHAAAVVGDTVGDPFRNFRPTQNDLIAKKLGEENIWLYGTQDYLNQIPKFSDIAELSEIQMIGFDRSNSVLDVLNKQGWQLSKDNFQVVTSFQPLQLELCKEGLGLIFFPEDLGDNDPKLVRAFEQLGPALQLPVWLVCHQELRTSLRVRRVFDFIADELRHS